VDLQDSHPVRCAGWLNLQRPKRRHKLRRRPLRRFHPKDTVANGRAYAGLRDPLVEVNIDPGTFVARHTHPGIESGYVVSGGLDLPIEGQPTRTLKPGDGFQVPVATPHAGAKNGSTKTVVVSTYVVEKGKPLASPA
jgi:hypothetical protein